MEIFIILVIAFYCLLVLTTIFQYATYKAVTELKEVQKQEQEPKKGTTARTHTSIEGNNYNGILNARGETKGYEVFKNKNGLYEPVRPSQGIRIEKPEEE